MTFGALALLLVAAQADELAPHLEAARAAAAHAELTAAPLRARGPALYLGVEGEHVLSLHPSGAFRHEVISALPFAVGSDGAAAWRSDWSGLARPLALGDREQRILLAIVLGGRWLDPSPPVAIALAPDAADDALALDLALKDGLEHARVLLDRDTHRVRSIGIGGTTWTIDAWTEPLGFPFPARIVVDERGGDRQVLEVAELERAPDLDAAALGRRPAPPADARFDAAAGPAVEARLARTGHLLIHPRVGGRDVGWFVLDTGAGALCITPEAARALALPALGSVTAAGISGSVQAPVRRGGTLVVGPLSIEDPTWVELDLAFLEPHFGVPVAGIAGYDVFARAVVAIDAQTPRVELFEPGAWSPPPGERWAPLALSGGIPCVEAGFEGGRRGMFRLDTGSNGTVVFHHAAVQRLGLLEGRATRSATTGGVGGISEVRAGTLLYLELAGRRRASLEATFETAAGPQAISAHVVGTIGGGVLDPFTLVLDYPGERAAFLARPDADSDSSAEGRDR